jgi:lipoic acid synthetase
MRPPWLKVRACGNARYLEVRSILRKHHLHTVCEEANCPNRGECFSSGTATFLIMGPNCTRNCTFCNVAHGRIQPLDPEEPEHVARAVDLMRLNYAVITSVTRDDLPDGGANHFARVVQAIHDLDEDIKVEVLTPDFKGRPEDVETVLEARPDVFNHNVETVPRLYGQVRPQADYRRSLKVLRIAADRGVAVVKSGLIVGVGETVGEIIQVFKDLKSAGVECLTIGQYLAPSGKHHAIRKYYTPTEFDSLAGRARECGIKSIFSAPLVRSSYHARELYRGK